MDYTPGSDNIQRHMNRKFMNLYRKEIFILIFAVFFTVAITLTSCGSKTEETVDRSPTEVVTIYFACPEQDLDKFKRLAEIFHEQNPFIYVEVVSLDDVRNGTTNEDIDRLVMSRVDTAYYWLTYEGAVDGSFLDLKPFIDADNNFDVDDFFPDTLTTFEHQGGIWALPSEAFVSYLLYNRDLFDEAGATYPEIGWSHEDFLSTAVKIANYYEAGTHFGYTDGARGAFISFFTDRRANDNISLLSPPIADDIRWYTDMASAPNVMFSPRSAQQGFDKLYELLEDGRIAMWEGSWLDYKYRQSTGNIGLTLYPTTMGGSHALAFMYGYVISSGSEYPQESWQWLQFLSHQTLYDGLYTLPTRRSVAEAAGFWEQFNPEDEAFWRFAAENLLVLAPVKPGIRQLHTAIDAILNGTPVEDALAEAENDLAGRMTILSQAGPFIVDTPGMEDGQRSITIHFAVPLDNNPIYPALVTEFHELQEDIQVNLLSSNQVSQADCFAGQEIIDPLEPPAELLNLQLFLARDGLLPLDNFQPALIDSLRSRGDLYGLPLQAKARVIFFNTRLFEKAGVNFPQANWTLDDFLLTAISLTHVQEETKQYGFVPLNGDTSDLRVFLALHGASTVDSTGRPYLDSAPVVNALQWYADLALQSGVAPLLYADDELEATNLLVQTGNVAMWSDFVGLDRHYVWPEETVIGIAPLPEGSVKGTDILTEGLFIASHTSHADACWEWLKFLSDQSELISAMPARLSTLRKPEFIMHARPGEVETYEVMQSYENLLAQPNIVAYYDELVGALYEVYAGGDPATVLQRIQTQMDE
jgi:sorbitol/mannitol transport system substrate-binding protein